MRAAVWCLGCKASASDSLRSVTCSSSPLAGSRLLRMSAVISMHRQCSHCLASCSMALSSANGKHQKPVPGIRLWQGANLLPISASLACPGQRG